MTPTKLSVREGGRLPSHASLGKGLPQVDSQQTTAKVPNSLESGVSHWVRWTVFLLVCIYISKDLEKLQTTEKHF